MVKLFNVIDTRDGNSYSMVYIKKKNAKWFVPGTAEEGESDENE